MGVRGVWYDVLFVCVCSVCVCVEEVKEEVKEEVRKDDISKPISLASLKNSKLSLSHFTL